MCLVSDPYTQAIWDAGFTVTINTPLKLSLPWYSDAFCVDTLGGDGLLQFVQLSSLL